MLVIHGTWAYGMLSLWAEDSGRPASAGPRLADPAHPGRPSRAPRPHPFAADPDVLAEAVAELAGPAADLARKAIEDELTLRLPSAPNGPLASPELVRAPDAAPASQAVAARARRLAGARADVRARRPRADLLAALGGPGAGSVVARFPGGRCSTWPPWPAGRRPGRPRPGPACPGHQRGRPLRRQVAGRAVRRGRAAGQGTGRRHAAAVPRRRRGPASRRRCCSPMPSTRSPTPRPGPGSAGIRRSAAPRPCAGAARPGFRWPSAGPPR